MKKDINRRTLWIAFLEPPTEPEIKEAANTMKDGKAYLFVNEDGQMIMRNRRRLNSFEKDEKFVRKIQTS